MRSPRPSKRSRTSATHAPGQVTLERALSKLGFASRTQARVLILAGQVSVNGVLRKNPRYMVNPERAKINVQGQTLEKAKRVVLLLHKPKGVVTTRSDEKGRPTVFSLIKEKYRHLIAVGRLDYATSGALLLTNDTKLAHKLTDPENKIPRVYVVTVRGLVTEDEIQKMKAGVHDEGQLLKADEVTLRKSSKKESHLTVTLSEGKNREIRRLFLLFKHEVTRLKRVSFGEFTLEGLEPRQYRTISDQELQTALRIFSDRPD